MRAEAARGAGQLRLRRQNGKVELPGGFYGGIRLDLCPDREMI